MIGPELATLEEEAVQSDYLMAGCLKHRYENTADVAVVPGDQDLHTFVPPYSHTRHGGLVSQSSSSSFLSRIVSMHCQKS